MLLSKAPTLGSPVGANPGGPLADGAKPTRAYIVEVNKNLEMEWQNSWIHGVITQTSLNVSELKLKLNVFPVSCKKLIFSRQKELGLFHLCIIMNTMDIDQNAIVFQKPKSRIKNQKALCFQVAGPKKRGLWEREVGDIFGIRNLYWEDS